MIPGTRVLYLWLAQIAMVGASIAAVESSVDTLTSELGNSKNNLVVYKQKLQTIYDTLQIPRDGDSARTCVIDKIQKIRNILSLFKKMSYFPKVQTGATTLDKALEDFDTSFKTATAKVPVVAKQAKTLQAMPVKKLIDSVDPLTQKIDTATSKMQTLKGKAISLQVKLNSFSDEQGDVDDKMQKVADSTNGLAGALNQISQYLNGPVTVSHGLIINMQSFVDAATPLTNALKATCNTVTINPIFQMIENLNDWLAAQYCIDSSNTCVGGSEVFSRTCDWSGTLCVGPYSLPQKCLSEVVTLRVCMIPQELLSKTLCGTVPDACVEAPSPISQTKCFSDLGIDREVCTDTNFASLVMNKLEELLPAWEVLIPFDGVDIDFTDADILSLTEPTLAELDSVMAKLPDIIVNAKFDGGKVTVTDNALDGTQTISGSLGVLVPNSFDFIQDASVLDACRTGIGHTFKADATSVTVSFTGGRRLRVRRLSVTNLVGTTVSIDYSVHVPIEKVSPTSAQQAEAISSDQVFQNVQTDIKLNKGDDFSFAPDMSHWMLVEAVVCDPLVDVLSSINSSCDAFVAEAFSPSNMACSGGDFSWSAEALASLCNCPQKLQILAKLDHDIKCGSTPRGKACQTSGLAPSAPGKTFGSSILQCPTQYQAVKNVTQQLVASTTLAATTAIATTTLGSGSTNPTDAQQGSTGSGSANPTATSQGATGSGSDVVGRATGGAACALTSCIQLSLSLSILMFHALATN